MNREQLIDVIIDQREMYINTPIIQRKYALEDNINYCFVGIRRTGKSYLMYQQINKLIDSGISISKILYVNFEDERLLEITVNDLNTILEIGLELANSEKPYLFFDEIQIVDGWEKFARRLADNKYHVCITGSNSKMLSSEIATTLGGRFVVQNVYPYSFEEYITANNNSLDITVPFSTKDKACIISLFNQYLQYGAFPELTSITNKRDYLNSIYQTIYLGDIIARNKITNPFAIKLILKKIAESTMQPLSFSRLTNILKTAGATIGKQTVINYIGYMRDSYLIFSIQNYIGNLVEKESSPKYYFADTGLLSLLTINNECALLENLVAIELIRRYGQNEVYFYNKNIEIDFYIPQQNLAIQVSYSIQSSSTYERELSAFYKFKEFMPNAKCLLLTNSEEEKIEYKDVLVDVMPTWKWLLNKN